MKRLDQLLVEEGYYPSRERARLAVMAGEVEIEGRGRNIKAGTRVREGQKIIVRKKPRFVSRGGDKLDGIMARWGLDVTGMDAFDAGASTGGFSQCLLQRGAARVISLDVGKGQLHWDLRQDPRVTVMEGVNARYLSPDDLPYAPRFITVDVSFISLRLVVPALAAALEDGGTLLALVKPQFEAGKKRVGKGGIVRDPKVHSEVLARVIGESRAWGLDLRGIAPSPLRGTDGNIEFFAWWVKGGKDRICDVQREVERAVNEAWEKK